MKIETSVVINRPVEEVFAVLSDFEKTPTWSSAFLEARKTSEGPIGVGTTWQAVGKSLGKRIETEIKNTDYEADRRFAQETKSPVPSTQQMTFERVNGSTRVNVRLEAEPGGFFKLAEPVFKTMAKRGIETDLANLKDLMEAHAL